MIVHAYAASGAKEPLKPFEYELGSIARSEVDIDVKFCGVCHSDLSMLNNDWDMTQYPLVPGHEVVGTVAAVGDSISHIKVGDSVGVGWFSKSCMTCNQCMGGNHNLCASAEGIMLGRHGGFADKVRVDASWVTPLPSSIDSAKAGPLFCGGITVFNPIVEYNVKPTNRVGVIGIGGLGHMALQFLSAWGCEVTAFSSNPDKEKEARSYGAHNFVNSKDPDALSALEGTFDFILCTANANLPWDSFISALGPKGKLHFVGVPPEPVSTHVFPLLAGQRSISATPLGSPATTRTMLEFCARHEISPITQLFPMSEVNEALEVLRNGDARYRLVLEAGK